jgi:pimeloyl-ACP methyl ester carboxylesterase
VFASTERLVDTNGVQLRVFEAGERGAPVVILTHGFPESAYSWRRQMPALAAAGYHVLVPDQRGYGGSARPVDIDAYDITALTGDLVGLLDDVGADRAAWIGHDWGAAVAWAGGLLHPERVAAVAGLSVPPVPRPQMPPIEAFKQTFQNNFFYMLYFQQPGVADAELAADPRRTMRAMLAGMRPPSDETEAMRMFAPGNGGLLDRLDEPDRLPDWLSEDDLDHYVAEFTASGFTGPLNWYRNLDRNWHIMAEPTVETIDAPALYLAGTADPVLLFTRHDRAREVVSGPYREVLLDGAGHWIQQERADDVNTALAQFLAEIEW